MANFKNKTDSPAQLFKRYNRANNRMLLQRSRLEEAYDYALPNRANFRDNVPGEQRNLRIFDNTAPQGLMQFANDVQSILMPPFQRWAKLVPGNEVPTAEKDFVTEGLEEATDIFFRHLEQSNFYQVSAEALTDMGISTGIIFIEEGTKDNPFIFRSVSISEVAFSEGRHGKIDNFWRRFETSLREALLMWPKLQLSESQRMQFNKNPDEVITLIEGTVLVPGKEEIDDEYQYYIQDGDTQKLMLEEKRDWNPWSGFRAAKTTGEIIGYGPIMRVLPAIRAVNKMVEYDMRAFKFAALGVLLVENSGVMNPFNMRVEPGAIIPVEPSVSGKDPVRALKLGTDPKITLEKIQAMQQMINQALFSNPLPPETKSGISATEISIRQQNWVRQNGAAFGRLTVELIEPTIVKGFSILVKKEIVKIPGFKIDKKRIDIKYESPLIAIQAQEDVQALQEATGAIASAFGAEGLGIAYNIPAVNEYINSKLGIPVKLVKTQAEMKKALQGVQQQKQEEAAAQQATQLPPGQEQQPQLPLAATPQAPEQS